MAIAVALVGAACEYPGVDRGLSATGASLPPAGGVDSASNPDNGQVVAGKVVEIELRDFELVPGDLIASSGEITFILSNGGRFTHDFRVEGEGVDEKSPRVGAGRNGEWSITLDPGEYRISCPISNHADRGMVGTLTVVTDAD
jgi:uncharacterized cupredoxin-like copper-binding protein